MAARGLVLLSRPLYACSHTTGLLTENGCWVLWIIIFLFYISNLYLFGKFGDVPCTYLVYEPNFWLLAFGLDNVCVNWIFFFGKSAKFIDWKTGWYDVSLSRQLLLQQKRKTSITTIWMSLTRKLLILSVSLQKRKYYFIYLILEMMDFNNIHVQDTWDKKRGKIILS